MSVQELIQEAQKLTSNERQQLIEALAQMSSLEQGKTRSLRELRGLGKEIWQGIDAQDYVDQLRDEWDNRP